ncbi:TPA: DNA polymerase III subunit gamma/tau [Patescibacteria group bacterium]|nr:MAG: polymerase III, subunit gamma and tau protein [Parcubacteria group bacterium GW2011_GWF2_40_10]KKR46710.1 MAG: polymerase III, subunit gamma and tau protein [Parcubacteria group bacterium GW2011_GWA2_40_143]KKR59394.1 MAG: polymerase III, subunit gamma and tau protein [Parcubacteria group bacterium GW2011_GWC2_40_31]KKR82217.1 MAG: polymerase III, subunit gamma and tau protein [Parcubacteria group bacterium GW2011_GWD2_40_9]HCI05050.1 DNA polymerase III subunit gamma/tau [Patescibacteri
MSKIVLYRKYRPLNFKDVLGQEHIVEVLKNAVNSGRVAHAYLFAGPRGTGKTSVARILAREAGCVEMDLLEIDAASSRGIDEIRALREGVRFSPLGGSVKVYIIDEVHMLTKEAFNALLKTLEEPPSHVIFILATTELDKVPETIISRCQNFTFRKISENVLRKAMLSIAVKEGFEIDEETAGLIALMADGSFRDAQGTLDQILSAQGGEGKIAGEAVRLFLSVPPRELVEKFIIAIMEKKAEEGLEAISEAVNGNIDMNVFLKLVLRDIRSMLLLKFAPNMRKQIEDTHSDKEFKFVEKGSTAADKGQLENILKILLPALGTKNTSYLPQTALELAFLDIVK